MAYPDTLVGTDSHTTMVNGMAVLGWGVGGIEAEAAMLGQPISMLIPEVIGFRLDGKLPEGTTATDLVLTATQLLRKPILVRLLPAAGVASDAAAQLPEGITHGLCVVEERKVCARSDDGLRVQMIASLIRCSR